MNSGQLAVKSNQIWINFARRVKNFHDVNLRKNFVNWAGQIERKFGGAEIKGL